MEDALDEWSLELREGSFNLKAKALQILREISQYNGIFSTSDGWLRVFLRRKDYTLRWIHGNMVSPGYVKVIVWLSEIWDDFDQNIIVDKWTAKRGGGGGGGRGSGGSGPGGPK